MNRLSRLGNRELYVGSWIVTYGCMAVAAGMLWAGLPIIAAVTVLAGVAQFLAVSVLLLRRVARAAEGKRLPPKMALILAAIAVPAVLIAFAGGVLEYRHSGDMGTALVRSFGMLVGAGLSLWLASLMLRQRS